MFKVISLLLRKSTVKSISKCLSNPTILSGASLLFLLNLPLEIFLPWKILLEIFTAEHRKDKWGKNKKLEICPLATSKTIFSLTSKTELTIMSHSMTQLIGSLWINLDSVLSLQTIWATSRTTAIFREKIATTKQSNRAKDFLRSALLRWTLRRRKCVARGLKTIPTILLLWRIASRPQVIAKLETENLHLLLPSKPLKYKWSKVCCLQIKNAAQLIERIMSTTRLLEGSSKQGNFWSKSQKSSRLLSFSTNPSAMLEYLELLSRKEQANCVQICRLRQKSCNLSTSSRNLTTQTSIW